MRFVLRLREATRIAVILLLVLGGAVCVAAQEERQTQHRTSALSDVPVAPQRVTSELTRDNLDLVAASAPQLKAVLVRDTGLMVELKRLCAGGDKGNSAD